MSSTNIKSIFYVFNFFSKKWACYFNIILYTENGMDNIEVNVEINESIFSDKVKEMEKLQACIASSIEHTIGLRVKVKLVAPGTITRSEGKAKRVFDQRVK